MLYLKSAKELTGFIVDFEDEYHNKYTLIVKENEHGEVEISFMKEEDYEASYCLTAYNTDDLIISIEKLDLTVRTEETKEIEKFLDKIQKFLSQ